MNTYKNILLISGSGRNTGKTTLACQLIMRFAGLNIVAIKITPHFHDNQISENVVIKKEGLKIMTETSTDGKKDSSKMLLAGAHRVFYIQTTDDHVLESLETVLERLHDEVPVIIESGGLGKYIGAGLKIFVTKNQKEVSKNSELMEQSDVIIRSGNADFDYSRITYSDNSWKII